MVTYIYHTKAWFYDKINAYEYAINNLNVCLQLSNTPASISYYKGWRNKALKTIAIKNCHGVVFTDSFNAFKLGSKNKNKICEITNVNYGLTLHERQSLIERIIASNTLNIRRIKEHTYEKYNLLLANLGFIFTDRIHEKGNKHKRIFKTMPIIINEYKIIYPAKRKFKINHNTYKTSWCHCEKTLFDFLCNAAIPAK